MMKTSAMPEQKNLILNTGFLDDPGDDCIDSEELIAMMIEQQNQAPKTDKPAPVIPLARQVQLEDAKTLEAYNCKSKQLRELVNKIFEEVSATSQNN